MGAAPDIRWAVAAPELPVAAMVLGRPVHQVAETLPLLFNLCRTAQGLAVRLALGLGTAPDARENLAQEILRDHVLRLAVMVPSKLGLPAVPFTLGDPGALRGALFGPTGRFPGDADAFAAFRQGGCGIGPVLGRLARLFARGEACADGLPPVDAGRLFDHGATENSVAARHADHPVMRDIAARWGRGPLWRATGRALDIEAALDGALPPPVLVAPGCAVVPAARGSYGVRARAEAGLVTAFDRVTPTDALLAPDGILARALASLPAQKRLHAGLVVDILDPCVPLTLNEDAHA